MSKKALVVIDIQNDITKHYRDIIDNINEAINWASENSMEIVYIQHNNLSAGTRTFKPGNKGADFAPELRVITTMYLSRRSPMHLQARLFPNTSGQTA